MYIHIEQRCDISSKFRDWWEARLGIISVSDVTAITRNSDITHEEKEQALTTIKRMLEKKMEAKVVSHVLEHFYEKLEEGHMPSYMDFMFYETPYVKQGKPLLLIHPADAVDYHRRGVIVYTKG